MPKSKSSEPDVLVLGDHPSAYFAAALLRENPAPLRVMHSRIPREDQFDRLVVLNPAFFELHKLLSPLKRKLELTPIYGLKFLADDAQTRSEWNSRSIVAYVTTLRQVHAAVQKLAEEADVELHATEPKDLDIDAVDEQSLHVTVNGKRSRPRLLLLAGALPPPLRRTLGLPDAWESGVVHRYTFLKLKGPRWSETAAAKPPIAMSLDLRGTLWWSWLTPGPGCVQIAVEQPLSSVGSIPPQELLRHWAQVLARHRELKESMLDSVDFDAARSIDLPLAGALAQEGVANRTLLLGPAGGFYSACAEDIYPNCWSAVFAAEAAKKALKERHVQDALQIYRQKWGATLGDFLRGPQQNLRFLLPLVYRNPMMTARLAEAILLGKSVVR
jgi:flavin-dependent dehydrogenase